MSMSESSPCGWICIKKFLRLWVLAENIIAFFGASDRNTIGSRWDLEPHMMMCAALVSLLSTGWADSADDGCSGSSLWSGRNFAGCWSLSECCWQGEEIKDFDNVNLGTFFLGFSALHTYPRIPLTCLSYAVQLTVSIHRWVWQHWCLQPKMVSLLWPILWWMEDPSWTLETTWVWIF